MKKDFDRWNIVKKQTNVEHPRFYTVREIWWCRLGVNVGTEQDGGDGLFLRPVVIVRAFGPETCAVIPLTTSERRHPLRLPVGDVQGEKATALISQMRVVDALRFSPSCEGKAEATCAGSICKPIQKVNDRSNGSVHNHRQLWLHRQPTRRHQRERLLRHLHLPSLLMTPTLTNQLGGFTPK